MRLGEKQALTEVMGFYSAVEVKLDKLEYYQERRLRSLNLLDRDGSSTYDPFEVRRRHTGNQDPQTINRDSYTKNPTTPRTTQTLNPKLRI